MSPRQRLLDPASLTFPCWPFVMSPFSLNLYCVLDDDGDGNNGNGNGGHGQ